MQDLQILNEKIDLLLKKHATVLAENKRLKVTVAQQLKSIDKLNEKLSVLEHDLGTIHVGKAVATTNDKNSMRKQLDTVIGEIDKILTTLND